MKINKHKKVYTTLNYIEHFFTLVFAVTGCIPLSDFASLVNIHTGIMSSNKWLNVCAIAVRIKKYKSIGNKKKKKHDEIVLLVKTKLNSIGVLIFKALMDSNISLLRFNLINDVLKNMIIWKKK